MKNYEQFLQRDFDVNETLALFRIAPAIFFSWGVEKITKIDNRGLLLKVNGHHWKHFVLVSLSWGDVYIVTLLDSDFNVHKSIDDVYVDMLIETIDKEVEYIGDYDPT